MSPEKYLPTWNSLKKHRTPEWIDDAKFGIYFHWGVYSVPAHVNEWYPHFMYRTLSNKHHKVTYVVGIIYICFYLIRDLYFIYPIKSIRYN